MPKRWFDDYDNIVKLTSYMARNNYQAHEIAYCVEKPWKFQEEYDLATSE